MTTSFATLLSCFAVLFSLTACGGPVPVWGVNVTVSVECGPGASCELPRWPGYGHSIYVGTGGSARYQDQPDAELKYSAHVEGADSSSDLWAWKAMYARGSEGGHDIFSYDEQPSIDLYRLDGQGEAHAIAAQGAEVTIDGNHVTARYGRNGRTVVERHEIVRLEDDPCTAPASSGWGW